METPWEEFWWNNITGPHVVVDNVATALLENKMVVLKVPSDLPWRHSMRGAIHTAFQERTDSSEIVIEPIDIIDDNPENIEPGRFILNRFASSLVSRGYREKSRVSIQDYISIKGVIKNRIIWVKGLAGKTAEQWIKFVRKFSRRSVAEGLFVLEIHGDANTSETIFLKFIDFSEYVSNYDVQLFNSFVLDRQKRYSDIWKKYISTTAAMLCDIDAEISEMLLRIVDFKNKSALDGIKEISEMPEFSRRGGERSSKHVLWYFRNQEFDELQHRIWASQVQVLFPIIELERVQLVKKWRQPIQETLESNSITQYGVLLHEAIDAELGTLCYMMSCRVSGDLYMLYIPNEEDRQRFRFLHDCRNLLAHASCCTPAQVAELLNYCFSK